MSDAVLRGWTGVSRMQVGPDGRSRLVRIGVLLATIGVAVAAAVAAVLAEPVGVWLAAFTSVLTATVAAVQLLAALRSRRSAAHRPVAVSLIVPSPRDDEDGLQFRVQVPADAETIGESTPNGAARPGRP